ncbi:MAG: cobalt-precorrin-5B (C(1))-methyltransferase [Pseudomonadota bacterium]
MAKASDQAQTASPLRRGWTTGACATAATKAALAALITGRFPDPVMITLPKGETPSFPLARENCSNTMASASIVKDAGDDPDVTHGALITSTVRFLPAGCGIVFCAGEGVGTVTKEGLPVPVGEPAINPTPRAMMRQEVEALCQSHVRAPNVEVTISVQDGEALAEKTWNGRLGIVGGLSILGTTGVVHPFSCSAWIHSIHRGIDVARAAAYPRVIAATGSTSEDAAQRLYQLPETALIDMGDFAGGVLKYLRNHPVPAITIAGGFAKLTKLAQGALDLHSGRSQVDFTFLCALAEANSSQMTQTIKQQIQTANTAAHVYEITSNFGINLAQPVAERALMTAQNTLQGAPVDVEIMIVSKAGEIIARAGKRAP